MQGTKSKDKFIGVRVTPDQEARLVEIQRHLAARNPDMKITMTRAATIMLRKGMDSTDGRTSS